MTHWFFTTIFVPLHLWLYETSGGKLGSQMGSIPALILYTRGRKSGKAYKIPLAYHREGDEYIVVASNYALPYHPGWYFNVLADDNASMRAGTVTRQVDARELTGEERETVWQKAIQTNPAWDGYRQNTERIIPLIALKSS